MSDYYCMYQKIENELIIFGVGMGEEKAKADAKKWIEPDDNVNELRLAKCTLRVYDYVNEHGGVADNGFRFVLEKGIVKTEDC